LGMIVQQFQELHMANPQVVGVLENNLLEGW
jgi:hypothetical protein